MMMMPYNITYITYPFINPLSECSEDNDYGWEGNCRKYWQPTTGFVINVTCRLTADRPESTVSPTFNLQV